MEVTLKLNSILKQHSKDSEGKINVTLKEGATIRRAMEQGAVAEDEVGIIILNSKMVQDDAVLSDGDVVELYPMVGGG